MAPGGSILLAIATSQPINAISPYAYAAHQSQAPIQAVAEAASELRQFDCDAFGPHADGHADDGVLLYLIDMAILEAKRRTQYGDVDEDGLTRLRQ